MMTPVVKLLTFRVDKERDHPQWRILDFTGEGGWTPTPEGRGANLFFGVIIAKTT